MDLEDKLFNKIMSLLYGYEFAPDWIECWTSDLAVDVRELAHEFVKDLANESG